MKFNIFTIVIVVIAGLSAALVKSCSDASGLQSDIKVLRSDNALQEQIIATQAFNFNRFNKVADHTYRLNSIINTRTEETVIKYREILRREKTCDLPVPADIAGGLYGLHSWCFRLSARSGARAWEAHQGLITTCCPG